MSLATKNLTEGVATFFGGLMLKLFTSGAEIAFVYLPEVRVVLMVIGPGRTLFGLFQRTRTTSPRG